MFFGFSMKEVFRYALPSLTLALSVSHKPVNLLTPQSDTNRQRLKMKTNLLYHHGSDISTQITQKYKKNLLILSGTSNKALAQEISAILEVPLGLMNITRGPDGEISIQLKENIRSKDIYIIQSTCPPVSQNFIELLFIVSTMRRGSACKINVIMPYYGYARQDRKTAPRVPISASDCARILESVGVDRIAMVDLHSGQIQGFFGPRVPVDNLQAQLVAMHYFAQQNDFPMQNLVVVSPDAGGVPRAKKFLSLIKSVGAKETDFAILVKQREQDGKVGFMNLVGDVKGKHVIIIDDLIDTAGTLSEAAKVLKQQGAATVRAFATHGVFSKGALQNIRYSLLDQIVVTNTIPANPQEHELGNKIVRLSVAPLLAETIYRIETKSSLQSLFRKGSL